MPWTARDGAAEQGADDATLLGRVARGDEAAFAALARRHYDPVYRALWRLTGGHADCEDVVQEAFFKLWTNPTQLRQPQALKSWLMRVATNLALDRLRRNRNASLDAVPEPAAAAIEPARGASRDSIAREIDGAILQLPERQRLALVLVHFEAMGNIGAARAMDISVEAVESLLARARRGIKAALADRWKDLLAEIGELEA